MDNEEKIHIEDRAWIGWHLLPEVSKADIRATLEPLAGTPPEKWPARVRPWRMSQGIYVVPFWIRNEEVYVFIKPVGGRIHLDGLYLREVVAQMQFPKPAGAP